MSDTRNTRISGVALKSLVMPTWLIILLLVLNALVQLASGGKFGVLMLLSGLILFFCTPHKTGGDGFWGRKTFTVWGVPILIFLSGGASIVIGMVAWIIQLVIYIFLALLLLFVVLKAMRNEDKLKDALNTVRNFGR